MVIPCLLLAEIYLIDTPHNSKWWATKCSGGVTVENINCWKRDVLKTIKYWLYVEPTRDYVNWTRQVKKLAFNLFGQNSYLTSNSPTLKVKPSSPINKPKLLSFDTTNNNVNIKNNIITNSTDPKIKIEPASPVEKSKINLLDTKDVKIKTENINNQRFSIQNLLSNNNNNNTILTNLSNNNNNSNTILTSLNNSNNNSNTILANASSSSLLNIINSNASYKLLNPISCGTSFSLINISKDSNNNKSNINTSSNINTNNNTNINTNTNTYTAYSSQTSSNTCNGTRPLNIPQPSLTEKMSIYNIVNSSDEDNSNNKFINSASSYTNASVPEKENSNSLYQSSVSNENHESSITSSSSFDIGRRRTVKASNSRHSSSILNQNNTSKFNPPSSLTSILEGARNSYEKGVKVDERSYSGDSDITRCNTQDNVLNNNGNNNYDKSVRNSYLSDITRVPTTASESSEIYCEPNDIFSKLKTLNRTNMPATFNDKLNIKGSDGQDISTSLISHLGYKNGLQSQQNQQASFISAPILKKSSRQSVLYYPTLYQSQNSNVSHNNYEVPTPGRSNSDSSNALSISSTDAVSISHTNSMSSVVTTSTLDSSNSNSSPKYTNGFNTPYSYLNAAPYLPKNSFNPQCTQTSSVSGSYNGNKSNLSIPFANTRGKNMLAQSSTQNSQELYRSDSMEIEEERKFLSPPTTPY